MFIHAEFEIINNFFKERRSKYKPAIALNTQNVLQFSCLYWDFSLVMGIWSKVLEIHWSKCVRTLLSINLVLIIIFTFSRADDVDFYSRVKVRFHSFCLTTRQLFWLTSLRMLQISLKAAFHIYYRRIENAEGNDLIAVYLFVCVRACYSHKSKRIKPNRMKF